MGRFLKTFGLYFIGNTASRLMSFLVMPFITQHVSNEDSGYFATVEALVNIVVIMLFISAWSGILRYLLDKDYDSRRMKRKVITAGYTIEIISLVIFTVGFIIVNFFAPIREAGFVYFFCVAYMLHQNVAFTVRGLGYNKLYVCSGILGSIVSFSTNLILVLVFHWGSAALILAAALSYFVPALFMEFFARTLKKVRLRDLDWSVVKTMARYCFPYSLNQGAYWITNRANTQIITIMMGLAATGVFYWANKFTSIIQLVVMVFNLAWQEMTFSMSHDADRAKKYNLMLKNFLLFVSCGLLFLVPVTRIVFPIFVRNGSQAGLAIIPLAYLGAFMDSLANFLGSVMCAEQRMKSQLTSTVVGAIITVVMMFGTIPIIGFQAAPLATILCFLAVVIMRTIKLRDVVKLNYQMGYLVHYGLMFALASLVFFKGSILMNVIFAVVVAVYCIIVLRGIIKDFVKMILKKVRS